MVFCGLIVMSLEIQVRNLPVLGWKCGLADRVLAWHAGCPGLDQQHLINHEFVNAHL